MNDLTVGGVFFIVFLVVLIFSVIAYVVADNEKGPIFAIVVSILVMIITLVTA